MNHLSVAKLIQVISDQVEEVSINATCCAIELQGIWELEELVPSSAFRGTYRFSSCFIRLSSCFCCMNRSILDTVSHFLFWRQNTKAPHWREGLGMKQISVDLSGT